MFWGQNIILFDCEIFLKIKDIKYTFFVMSLGHVANIFVVFVDFKSGKNNFPYDYLLFLHRSKAKLLMVTSIIRRELSPEFSYLHTGWILWK